MEREAAIRLLRALVAVGLRQRELMANTAIRTVAIQAEVDEFDAARRYAREQGWLIEGKGVFDDAHLGRLEGCKGGNSAPSVPASGPGRGAYLYDLPRTRPRGRPRVAPWIGAERDLRTDLQVMSRGCAPRVLT